MPSFTKQVIMRTFQQMLESTPFDKITVSAITKAAGIGHNTFYYHYEDIYALLNAWLSETLDKYTRAESSGEWKDNVKAMLHACKEHASIVYHVFNSLSRDRLERYVFSSTNDAIGQYIRRQAEGRDVSEEQLRHITKVCRYAIFGFYLEFLWNDMEDDIDASVDKLMGLFACIIDDTIRAASDARSLPDR